MLFEQDGKPGRKRRPSALRPPSYDHESVKAFGASARTTGFVLNDFSRSKIDWAWTCDASLCLSDISEGFTTMTSLITSSVLGMPLEALGDFAAGDKPAASLAMLARGEGVTQAPFMLKTQGEPLLVHLTAVPVFGAGGGFMGIEGGVSRIPAQKTQNDEVDVAAGRQLDMAHQVQHELRTPLNAIAGFAQIMREDLQDRADGRYAAYCDDILSASQHLLGLIDDLVGAHGAQQQNLTAPTVTQFSLSTLLDEMGRMVKPMAQKAGRTFVLNAPAADIQCTTDRRRLKQICINLLENAAKFSPEGRSFGLVAGAPFTGVLDVSIWDEGPGIPEADQAMIWERFQKAGAPSSQTASSPGLGLGLSVVKSLADSIGAQVILDSEVGRGSRFTIRLPQVS